MHREPNPHVSSAAAVSGKAFWPARTSGFVLVMLSALCLLPAMSMAAGESYPLQWEGTSRPAGGVKAPIETSDGQLLSVQTVGSTGSVELVCFRSADGGGTWSRAGTIAADKDLPVDLGDAALLQLRDGSVLCSYRHIHNRKRPKSRHSYAIEVARSSDGGASWSPHSTVAYCHGETGGLWSSFLLEKRDGTLQCYYDNEYIPWQRGHRHHQWVTMKSWDARRKKWSEPVTVSRAHNPRRLSRDGMPSAVELADGRLVCVVESVRVEPPHKGIVFCVSSDDGGRRWSWRSKERSVVYETSNTLYNSLAPWTVQLTSGTLVCVFVTDEDRAVPDVPATARLDEDVKAVYSFDNGVSWSAVPQLIGAEHPCYLPGIVQITRGARRGEFVVQYASRQGAVCKTGRPVGR